MSPPFCRHKIEVLAASLSQDRMYLPIYLSVYRSVYREKYLTVYVEESVVRVEEQIFGYLRHLLVFSLMRFF